MLWFGSWIFHALGLRCGVFDFLFGFRLLAAGPFGPPIFPVSWAVALGARLLFVAGAIGQLQSLLFSLMLFVLLYHPYLLSFYSVILFLDRYVLMEAENASRRLYFAKKTNEGGAQNPPDSLPRKRGAA